MGQRHRRPIGRRASGEGRRTFGALVAAAAVACALGLFHTWTRVAVLDRSYQLGRARALNEKLHHQLEELRLEVATLQSTTRVDRAAEGTLHMHRPTPERTVVLDSRRPPTPVKQDSLAVNAPQLAR